MNTDLTITQVATLTGRSPHSLRRLARTDRLPGAYRLGGLWLIRREALDAIRKGASVGEEGAT